MVGLGNPGEEYARTRHNGGFLLLDALRVRWRFPAFRRLGRAGVTDGVVSDQTVVLIQPRTYMNESGSALRSLTDDPDFAPARDLLVLVDDAAIPLGTFRLRARGTAGGHNGLKSVQGALRSTEYARLRIGIGPVPEGLEDLAAFVLAEFTDEERATLDALLPTMADAVECWLADGIDTAMNRFNRLRDSE